MKLRDWIDLMLLAAVWGASFLFMRVGVPDFGPVALVEMRLAIATLFLLPILRLQAGLGELAANWRPLTILGLLNSAIPFLLFSYGTLYVTAGYAAVINATAPLWGALVAWLWLSDRLPTVGIIGIITGFFGVAVLTSDTQSLASPGSIGAAIAAVGGAFFYGIGANFARRYTKHLNSLSVATGSMLFPALLLAPVAIAYWPDVPPAPAAWIAIIAMGIVSTGFAYILYFRLISNVGPAKAITVAYLIPVFAMMWGVLLLGETISGRMIIGCAIIFLGTALVSGFFQRNRVAASN